MSNTVYYIWSVLPAILLFLSIRGFLLPYMNKRAGREPVKDYLLQLAFTSGFLLISIFLDKTFFVPNAPLMSLDTISISLIRFFQYPLLLFLAAYVQRIYNKEYKKEKEFQKPKFR